MKKTILLYSQDNFFFINSIINRLNKKYKIFLIESDVSFLKKIKVLICLLLFSKLSTIINIIKNGQKLNKDIIRNKMPKKFTLAVSIAHQKKIIKKNKKIYNFHLGNLNNQRGSFIFFYKFKYMWKYISLTCHEITDIFDKGDIICSKKISVKNKNAVEILNLYHDNFSFISNTIELILSSKFKPKKIINFKKINKTPSFYEILMCFIKRFIKILI